MEDSPPFRYWEEVSQKTPPTFYLKENEGKMKEEQKKTKENEEKKKIKEKMKEKGKGYDFFQILQPINPK